MDGPPKTAASRRIVTIPAAILPNLRAHLERYSDPGPQGRVFLGPRGAGLRSSTFMARDFTPAVQRIGLSGIRFQSCGTPATPWPAATGASLADLMARMGHASVDAALRYQHAARTHYTAIAGALSEMIVRARPA